MNTGFVAQDTKNNKKSTFANERMVVVTDCPKIGVQHLNMGPETNCFGADQKFTQATAAKRALRRKIMTVST